MTVKIALPPSVVRSVIYRGDLIAPVVFKGWRVEKMEEVGSGVWKITLKRVLRRRKLRVTREIRRDEVVYNVEEFGSFRIRYNMGMLSVIPDTAEMLDGEVEELEKWIAGKIEGRED